MNDRLAEFVEQANRYLRETAEEWADSVDDSPPSHVYSAILGALIVKFLSWLV